MIVLDSSAAVEFLVGSEHGPWVEEQLLADDDLHAPHLLDIEVAGALRRLVRLDELSVPTAEEALADLTELDLARYPHVPLLGRIWELRNNLSATDAVFVALAEELEADLVTTDRRLTRAPGIRARVVAP